MDRYTTVVADVEAVDDPDALAAAVADAHEGLDALKARGDRIGYLTFEFERPEGERLDDDAFFKQACRHERGRERTAAFLRAFIAWRDHVFETEGRGQMYSSKDPRKKLQPTLLGSAFRLAEADAQYAALYADFIERTDLEHEGDQPKHIDALVDEHGWTPGVRDLLAARLTTARSQRSHEHLRRHAGLIRDNLPTPRHESALFDQLFEHCKALRDAEYAPDDIAVDRARRWGERLLDDDERVAWMAGVREMLES